MRREGEGRGRGLEGEYFWAEFCLRFRECFDTIIDLSVFNSKDGGTRQEFAEPKKGRGSRPSCQKPHPGPRAALAHLNLWSLVGPSSFRYFQEMNPTIQKPKVKE